MEYTTNAPKGAAYLDTVRPGWANEINLARFNINDTEDCVIGQLYGNYREGRAELFGIEPDDYAPNQAASDRESYRLSVEYGFDYELDVSLNFTAWQAEWVQLIQERQTA